MRVLAAESAPAKVNLALHVTGRRADGYHDLDSLVVFAGIGDELTARTADADRLAVTGPFAGQITRGQTNLVARAVEAFRHRWPGAVATGLDVALAKNLPVSAGIGGGSADAAAALRLMARLASVDIDRQELAGLAATLGADVPVCLLSEACLMQGLGDTIVPLAGFPACHIVLVNPLLPIATPDIFRRLKSRHNPPLPPLPDPIGPIAMLGLWLHETRNDLEQTAIDILPLVADLKEAMAATPGAMFARMSGSGATVFALYASAALAHQAAHDLRAKFPDFWVAAAPVITG